MTDFNSTDKLEQSISNYLAGQATPQEREELLSLLRSDAEAAQLFKQLSAVRAIASVPAFAEEAEANLLCLKKQMSLTMPLRKLRTWPVWLKAAAVVLLLLATNFSWYHYTDHLTDTYTNQQNYYEIKVPAGSRTGIELPDGTEVTLNAGSVLRYYRSFGISDRRVQLRGEGYFKVAKNKEVPFLVNTDGLQVQVVGTVFNVSAYENEKYITVDLVEGKVNLNMAGSGGVCQLYPNERAVYDRLTKKMSKSHVNALKAAEWINNQLVFDNESFEDIAKKLEREFRVKIVIQSERLKKEHFSGSFDGRRAIGDILKEIDVENQYVQIVVGDTIYVNNK